MTRFWQILALVMLALMVPASTCCEWLDKCTSHECGCCSDSEQEVPAQPETCPSATLAHSQMPAPVVLPAVQMIELVSIIHEMMRLNELVAVDALPLPLMTTAPPQLRTTWVFVSRAALPARAPAKLA